jgi:PAP2 superfamily
MRLLIFILLCFVSIPSGVANTAPKAAKKYNNKVATDWFKKCNKLTKYCPGFYPPIAARAYAYEGITLYQAILPGMDECLSLSGQLTDLKINIPTEKDKEYNWSIVANSALAFITKKLYANMPDSLLKEVEKLEIENTKYYSINESNRTIDRSTAYGKTVSSAIWEWSKNDGGNAAYLNSKGEVKIDQNEGDWIPTSPNFSAPVLPKWGNNRPFVPNCTASTQPSSPSVTYSSVKNTPFFAQAEEVYKSVKYLKPEQKVIAAYWSDDAGYPGGTPAGHSISIATQLLEKENINLALSAELYAKLGIALSDGFVSCWKTKYDNSLMRPITFIQKNIDPNWKPFLNTPPFPEFTSGHSVQSGATALILASYFGENYAFVDMTHKDRKDINGTPRKFSSFTMFATEAAMSRLFGGIHYREAIESGIKQGAKVSKHVLALHWRK